MYGVITVITRLTSLHWQLHYQAIAVHLKYLGWLVPGERLCLAPLSRSRTDSVCVYLYWPFNTIVFVLLYCMQLFPVLTLSRENLGGAGAHLMGRGVSGGQGVRVYGLRLQCQTPFGIFAPCRLRSAW